MLHNYRAEAAVCMSRQRTPCPAPNPFIPLSPLPQVSHVSSRGSENEPREGDHKEASGLQKVLGQDESMVQGGRGRMEHRVRGGLRHVY